MEDNQTEDGIVKAHLQHEVDPLLSRIVLGVNEGAMLEQQVWLLASGLVLFGTLVSFKRGFSALTTLPLENEPVAVSRNAPMYAYLVDVKIMVASNVTVNAPATRVKLSHVSAWGFGVPH